ncbi:divalent metal cation transporter [Stieleria varia]|uniref:Divalent metal cation transporter MntH n=1 Tax=Stieleria varia TaxID=2528005 RepID=A0A5C6ASB8_9BACT|nr:divalent metal cation transporter [Stieleria varia]TWU02391.1 Divalent metal cation transporter MntH [Stieleria varia]
MADENTQTTEDALLETAQSKGFFGKAAIYTRLSGPGWLQGAITLGGGSLAGALYLGVLCGYELMWLQPVAMILGVIMLSAISYVALSTGERPFQTLKNHISPVLAWGWLIATMMANIVWCLPQFALGTAAVEQNLIPSMEQMAYGKHIIAGSLLVIASIVIWFYNSGSKGIKLFELILKAMVGVVVLSFFGVVFAMTWEGALDWGKIFAGLIPNPRYLFEPVPAMTESIAATGEQAGWWTSTVANLQKDRIITAFATAVGINMTFLLPYSMLRKGWGTKHRGLAIYDLSIGLIVPFVLATSCVVIAAASQFHGKSSDVLVLVEAGKTDKTVKDYYDHVDRRLSHEKGDSFKALLKTVKDGPADAPEVVEAMNEINAARAALPQADKEVAALITGRDNFALAETLEPLVGSTVAQTLFGIGVLGMGLSTIIILMLINGFAFCELIDKPADGMWHRIGCFIPAVGVLGPFFWSKAAPALATPTSVIGGAMLPIAYLSFLLLMNSKRAIGNAAPTGTSRVVWNALMIPATFVALFGSAWGLMGKTMGESFPIGNIALGVLAVMLVLGVLGFLKKQKEHASAENG